MSKYKIIRLIIIIRYIYGSKKAFKKPPSQEPPSLRGSLLGLKLSKPSAFADSCFKKSFWLPEGTAFGFEAGEGKARTMDKNGNTTQKGSWHYTYDYKNKIITASNGSKTISFEYDPFGRRIKKDTGSNTINYYYAGDQVIEEQNSTGQTIKQFVYGNLIDEIIRMDKYNNNTIENSFYYHTDSIGNITAITDKGGNIVEKYKYNIYGSPTITDNTGNILNSSAIGNDYMFQSRRYDKELKLYYYRARAYDPEIGRFLQTDPIGYKDSMNLYQAMNMNPWGFVDPWGEEYFIFNGNDVTIYKNKAEYFKHKEEIRKNPFLSMLPNLDAEYEGNILGAPDKYRDMILNNNLQNLSSKIFNKIEFLDKENGEDSYGYNATAHVYNSRGNGEIEYDEFDARTYASDPEEYPTIMNGEYVAVAHRHNGKYPALQLRLKRSLSVNIPIWGYNKHYESQYYYAFRRIALMGSLNGLTVNFSLEFAKQYYATGINIHHPFYNKGHKLYDYAYDPEGVKNRNLSQGCLLIRTSQWKRFITMVEGQRYDVKIDTYQNSLTGNMLRIEWEKLKIRFK